MMEDLTAFQRDLLRVVDGMDEPHGLAIKEEMEDYYEKEIHHGRLYPNLDTLCDKGLVRKGQKDRRTNWYKATKHGRRAIQFRSEWNEARQRGERPDTPDTSADAPSDEAEAEVTAD